MRGKLQINSSFLQFLAKLLYFVSSLNYKMISCTWQDAVPLVCVCVCVCIMLSIALLDENAEQKNNNEAKQLLRISRDGEGLSG